MPAKRIITLTFDGDPIPAPRPRFGQGATYMPPRYTAYKEALAWAFKAKMGRRNPMRGSIILVLYFHRKNHLRVDLDNLEKTVLDAGGGVVWEDDSQIVDMCSSKFLGCDEPRVEIRLEEAE